MSNTLSANPSNAIEVMGRKAFDAFLHDVYGCKEKNNVKAEIDLECDDVYRVEVLNSPQGLLIAAHEMDRVHVLRLSAVIGLSEFWSNVTPEEDAETNLTPQDEVSLSEMDESVLR